MKLFHPTCIPLLVSMLGLAACQQATDTGSSPSAPAALPATETSKDFGEYVVHVNALPTDELTAEIAKAYGIVRSKNRAMLNVSVIKKAEGTLGTPVSGEINASATNLTGQLKNLTLREITEGDAIYFIGEVPVANGETLIFNIEGSPAGGLDPFTLRFQKQFYTD